MTLSITLGHKHSDILVQDLRLIPPKHLLSCAVEEYYTSLRINDDCSVQQTVQESSIRGRQSCSPSFGFFLSSREVKSQNSVRLSNSNPQVAGLLNADQI